MVCEGQNLTLLQGFVTIQSVDHVKVLNRDDSEETAVSGIRSSRKSKDRTGRKSAKDFISARRGMHWVRITCIDGEEKKDMFSFHSCCLMRPSVYKETEEAMAKQTKGVDETNVDSEE